jgi:hypothetical protein
MSETVMMTHKESRAVIVDGRLSADQNGFRKTEPTVNSNNQQTLSAIARMSF